MRRSLFAVSLALVVNVSGASAASPSQAPKPTAATKITLTSVAPSAPGAALMLEAKLLWDSPIPAVSAPVGYNQPIVFRLQATRGGPPISLAIGSALTNTASVATIKWAVPSIKPGTYTIHASYAGSETPATLVGASSDTTPLQVSIK